MATNALGTLKKHKENRASYAGNNANLHLAALKTKHGKLRLCAFARNFFTY
jgi:hypothetical protein